MIASQMNDVMTGCESKNLSVHLGSFHKTGAVGRKPLGLHWPLKSQGHPPRSTNDSHGKAGRHVHLVKRSCNRKNAACQLHRSASVPCVCPASRLVHARGPAVARARKARTIARRSAICAPLRVCSVEMAQIRPRREHRAPLPGRAGAGPRGSVVFFMRPSGSPRTTTTSTATRC